MLFLILLCLFASVHGASDSQSLSLHDLRKKYNYYGKVEPIDIELINAAGNGDEEKCKLYLWGGANKNAMRNAPLLQAIRNQHIKCVRLLMQQGASLKFFTGHHSPLEVAAEVGDKDIVNCLLDVGAHPDMGITTPLIQAVAHNHLDIAELLIARGATPTLGYLTWGDEPIHHAAGCGNNEAIKMLIKHGNNINARGVEYQTPLDFAVGYGHRDTVALLKSLGAKHSKDLQWPIL